MFVLIHRQLFVMSFKLSVCFGSTSRVIVVDFLYSIRMSKKIEIVYMARSACIYYLFYKKINEEDFIISQMGCRPWSIRFYDSTACD